MSIRARTAWRRRIAGAVLLPALWALASCGDGSDAGSAFAPPVATDLGGAPGSLAWIDADGDRRPDLLYVSSGVAWLALGNGDGGLSAPRRVSVQAGLQSVSGGDLDGDGRVDVIALRCEPTSCALFAMRGNGDGSFQAPVRTPLPHAPVATFAVGDLNADGRADVVAASTSFASVLPGRGDGTFGAPADTALTVDAPFLVSGDWYRALAADLDRDGRLDVLLLGPGPTYHTRLVVLAGAGDGTLAPPREASGVPATVGRYDFADFNRDGVPDLVFNGSRFRGDYPTAVMLSDGLGGFTLTDQPKSSQLCWSFAVGDFDGDGIDDIVGYPFDGSGLAFVFWLFKGRGDGTFDDPRDLHDGAPATDRLEHAVDADGDGRADLVFTTATGVAVRLNRIR